MKDEKIIGSWLCYNHAALCELFRGTTGLAPLHGVCVAGQQPMFKSEVPHDGTKVKAGTKESPIKVKRESKDDVEKLTEGMKKLHGTSLINQES